MTTPEEVAAEARRRALFDEEQLRTPAPDEGFPDPFSDPVPFVPVATASAKLTLNPDKAVPHQAITVLVELTGTGHVNGVSLEVRGKDGSSSVAAAVGHIYVPPGGLSVPATKSASVIIEGPGEYEVGATVHMADGTNVLPEPASLTVT